MARIVLGNQAHRLLPVFLVLADYAPSASLLAIWETGRRYEERHKDCIVGSFKGDLYGFLRELAFEIGSDLDGISLASALPVLLRFSYLAYGDTDLGFVCEIDDVDDEDDRARFYRIKSDFSDISMRDETELRALLDKWYPRPFLDAICDLRQDVDKVR